MPFFAIFNQLITVLLFNFRLLYELKYKFVSLKSFMGFSIFDSVSFLLKFVFLSNKMHGLFDFKTSYYLSKLK